MSRSSRRKKRRARAERVGHGRGRGVEGRTIWLNPPGASSEEILRRILRCLPPPALEDLARRCREQQRTTPGGSGEKVVHSDPAPPQGWWAKWTTFVRNLGK